MPVLCKRIVSGEELESPGLLAELNVELMLQRHKTPLPIEKVHDLCQPYRRFQQAITSLSKSATLN